MSLAVGAAVQATNQPIPYRRNCSSRNALTSFLLLVPRSNLHADRSNADGALPLATRRHVPSRRPYSPDDLTPSRTLQRVPKCKPHNDTLLSEGHRPGHRATHPLQRAPPSRTQANTYLGDGASGRTHAETSFAPQNTLQVTCRHAHFRWRQSPDHSTTLPMQTEQQYRQHADTSITAGTAVRQPPALTSQMATQACHLPKRPLQMSPQSKPHDGKSNVDGAAVQATHRHEACSWRRRTHPIPTRHLHMATRSRSHAFTSLSDGDEVQAT